MHNKNRTFGKLMVFYVNNLIALLIYPRLILASYYYDWKILATLLFLTPQFVKSVESFMGLDSFVIEDQNMSCSMSGH